MGQCDGTELGRPVGSLEGENVGVTVEGCALGDNVGASLGMADGKWEGLAIGK